MIGKYRATRAKYNIVVVRTPFRVSFLGGGTDYPEYYYRKGGQVLVTTIDKYGYIVLNKMSPLVEEKFRISYSKLEFANKIEDIEHNSVRGCFKFYNVQDNLYVSYAGDLPARSGVGSSSSFTVGLVNALHAISGRMVTKEQIALEAIYIEQKVLKERVGSQDQYSTALGGFRHIYFNQDGTIHSELIMLSQERKLQLERSLMFFYTGIKRTASEILKEQIEKTKSRDNDNALEELSHLVMEGKNVLLDQTKDLDDFGKILHQGWKIKKTLSSKVSNSEIDEIYQTALKNGALGGKLMGAGMGGTMMFYVPIPFQDRVRLALKKFVEFKCQFESNGTVILYLN